MRSTYRYMYMCIWLGNHQQLLEEVLDTFATEPDAGAGDGSRCMDLGWRAGWSLLFPR